MEIALSEGDLRLQPDDRRRPRARKLIGLLSSGALEGHKLGTSIEVVELWPAGELFGCHNQETSPDLPRLWPEIGRVEGHKLGTSIEVVELWPFVCSFLPCPHAAAAFGVAIDALDRSAAGSGSFDRLHLRQIVTKVVTNPDTGNCLPDLLEVNRASRNGTDPLPDRGQGGPRPRVA
jgi:hypothetical protein